MLDSFCINGTSMTMNVSPDIIIVRKSSGFHGHLFSGMRFVGDVDLRPSKWELDSNVLGALLADRRK